MNSDPDAAFNTLMAAGDNGPLAEIKYLVKHHYSGEHRRARSEKVVKNVRSRSGVIMYVCTTETTASNRAMQHAPFIKAALYKALFLRIVNHLSCRPPQTLLPRCPLTPCTPSAFYRLAEEGGQGQSPNRTPQPRVQHHAGEARNCRQQPRPPLPSVPSGKEPV
jgi:hypothetical protein